MKRHLHHAHQLLVSLSEWPFIFVFRLTLAFPIWALFLSFWLIIPELWVMYFKDSRCYLWSCEMFPGLLLLWSEFAAVRTVRSLSAKKRPSGLACHERGPAVLCWCPWWTFGASISPPCVFRCLLELASKSHRTRVGSVSHLSHSLEGDNRNDLELGLLSPASLRWPQHRPLLKWSWILEWLQFSLSHFGLHGFNQEGPKWLDRILLYQFDLHRSKVHLRFPGLRKASL